jgi:hypothetical protein
MKFLYLLVKRISNFSLEKREAEDISINIRLALATNQQRVVEYEENNNSNFVKLSIRCFSSSI